MACGPGRLAYSPHRSASVTTLCIRAIGRPAPEGSHEIGAHGYVKHSSNYLPAWRRAVQVATLQAIKDAGCGAPAFPTGVRVYIHSMDILVGDEQCRAAGTVEPIGDPDYDKLLRATTDGMGDGRAFSDDAQITDLWRFRKRRIWPGEEPGAIIIISDEPPRESNDMQEYKLTLARVDDDGDSTVFQVRNTPERIAMVLPTLGILLGDAPVAEVPYPVLTPEEKKRGPGRPRKAAAPAAPVDAVQNVTPPAAEPTPEAAPARVNPFAVG